MDPNTEQLWWCWTFRSRSSEVGPFLLVWKMLVNGGPVEDDILGDGFC